MNSKEKEKMLKKINFIKILDDKKGTVILKGEIIHPVAITNDWLCIAIKNVKK